jgi:hypothetical protein
MDKLCGISFNQVLDSASIGEIGISSGGISNTTLSAWSPTLEEFGLKLSTATIGTKDGPYLVRCAGTERTNAGTEKIAYLLIIDGDSRIDENGEVVSGAPDPIEVSRALGGISHIISSSHSNSATKEELDAKVIDSGGLYGADYHKYRVYIICTYTPEQLPALLEYFFNQLHKAGVMLAPVPENKTWAQAWYLPRVPDSARLELHKFIDEEGARLDVEQIHSDWLSTQPAVEEPLLVERTDSYTADCKRDPIAEFNQAVTVHDVLLRNDYVLVGERYQRPNSCSNTPGVTLCKKTKDSKGRIYSHGGDVLNDSFAHDAFDCMLLLECDGDWKKALNWNADITKHNQSLFMENKSTQETFDSFDILVGVAPKEINTNKDFPLPFRGAMASIVASGLASAHKPQPKLTVLSALIGMASAIEGIYHFVDGTRVNLYGLGIAETGEGKEKLRYLANEVGRKAGALLLGKPASGQGLEDALVDRQGMLVVVDEVGHMLQSMNHKQSASYLIELTEMLLKLYSASSGSYSPRVKAFSKGTQLPRVLNNPCLSFLGFTTPVALSKGVSSENIEQGFLGRFLIVDGENNVKHRRVAQEFSLDTEMIERISVAISLHSLCSKNVGLIAETPDADSKLNILINKFVEEASKAPTPESRALLKRSYEKVIRIAGVLAVWDCPDEPVVTVEHIDWSETFVRYSNQCLLEFAENNIHENQQLADAAKVLDVVKKLITEDIKISNKSHHVIRKLNSNWVAKSAVLKASKLFKVQFDMALAHLLTMESLGEGIYNNTNTNKNIGYLYLEET